MCCLSAVLFVDPMRHHYSWGQRHLCLLSSPQCQKAWLMSPPSWISFCLEKLFRSLCFFSGSSKAHCSSLSPSQYFYTDNLKANTTFGVLFLGMKPYRGSQMFTSVHSLASAALSNIFIVWLTTFIPLKLPLLRHFSFILQAFCCSQDLFDYPGHKLFNTSTVIMTTRSTTLHLLQWPPILTILNSPILGFTMVTFLFSLFSSFIDSSVFEILLSHSWHMSMHLHLCP